MKHIYLILFLLTVTSVFSYAQRFEGGVLGGLNASHGGWGYIQRI